MGTIRVLPESLANQIAAGEVVERPASVVKELVENSLDAGAAHIWIRLQEAGLMAIEVEDDGSGMDGDDLQTAFLRHATSKLAGERDLFRIRTLGFRGEALPSIASVSRLTAVSAREEGSGVSLFLQDGEVREQKKVTARKGTLMRVEQLFYNTPARLKYLRGAQTELGHVLDVVTRLACAHPQVGFVLLHEGKELLRTSGSGRLLEVIQSVYGLNIARQMIPVKADDVEFSLEGWVSRPELTRSNRSYLTFLVNGRAIRSALLNHSLLQAYHTLLPAKRFPIAVLHVRMDPQLVDVNVHPSKIEVRFSKEQMLTQWLEKQIRYALQQSASIVSFSSSLSGMKQRSAAPPQPEQPERQERQKSVRQLQWMMPQEPPPALPQERNAPSMESATTPPESIDSVSPLRLPSGVRERRQDFLCVKEVRQDDHDAGSPPILKEPLSPDTLSQLSPVAQVHGTYILAEWPGGLFLIDQHAAQERILYETLRRQIDVERVAVQPLLVPLTVELSARDWAAVHSHDAEFRRLGVQWEEFGQHTLLLRALPVWIAPDEVEEWFWQMVRLVSEGRSGLSAAEWRDRAVMSMACKGAIKANRFLKKEEMEQLLRDLSQMKDPLTCPHGRPVAVHFSTYELEKLFKRVM